MGESGHVPGIAVRTGTSLLVDPVDTENRGAIGATKVVESVERSVDGLRPNALTVFIHLAPAQGREMTLRFKA